MSEDGNLRGRLVKNVSKYFDNLKDASKDNENLCILLDTIRARVIDIIWEEPSE